MASQVRERVKSLFAAVENIVSFEALENGPPVVPEQFLRKNNIRLVSHDRTLYENWVTQNPCSSNASQGSNITLGTIMVSLTLREC